uniref:Uncharacterized protein n=1 Tax=Anguilla anguilla TaxID=7936 RepID=A0A0E9XUT3_ANGAN
MKTTITVKCLHFFPLLKMLNVSRNTEKHEAPRSYSEISSRTPRKLEGLSEPLRSQSQSIKR